MELDMGRNMFVVIISEKEQQDVFDCTIYVQGNAGCGFYEIPQMWADLPIKYFESIYYGINGEYPKLNEDKK